MTPEQEIWRDLQDWQKDIYDRTMDNIEYWQQQNEGRDCEHKCSGVG